jgi:hypothetical protein
MQAIDGDADFQISLLDIVTFLEQSYRKLLLAATAGLLLGLGGWHFLVGHQAEWVLHNNTTSSASADTPSSYALDLVSWRTIQRSLPNLADQFIEEGKAPQDKAGLYRAMSDALWWQKNVTPNFAITKADTKDFAAIGKSLDGASTTILSLTVKVAGGSREQALDNVRAATQFLLKGGAYLQIKSLINGLESEIIGTAADIQSKITDAQIELGYLHDRAKSLEQLLKRFPGSTGTTQQIIDPKESSAKFLPLSTQLIAVNTDINLANENLTRFADRLAQIALMKSFLEQALPLVEQNLDGITLAKALLGVEAKLRVQLKADDAKARQSLDALRSQLLTIESRFTKGLEPNTAPSAQKSGMLKSATTGLTAALFLALLLLLGSRVWAAMHRTRTRVT